MGGFDNTLALLEGFPLDLRQLSACHEVTTLAGANLDPHRKLAALGAVAHGEFACALQDAFADLWDLQLVIPVDAGVVGGSVKISGTMPQLMRLAWWMRENDFASTAPRSRGSVITPLIAVAAAVSGLAR